MPIFAKFDLHLILGMGHSLETFEAHGDDLSGPVRLTLEALRGGLDHHLFQKLFEFGCDYLFVVPAGIVSLGIAEESRCRYRFWRAWIRDVCIDPPPFAC